MIASVHGMQPERGTRQHEIARLQSFAETIEIATQPTDGLGRATRHGPQRSRVNGRTVDRHGQSARVRPILERPRFEMARYNRASIDPVVGDEFSERLARRPEHELVQLDDWKSCRNTAINPNPKGHLAFDRGV